MVPGPSSVDSYRPWTFMYKYIMGPGPSSVFFIIMGLGPYCVDLLWWYSCRYITN